MKSATSDASAVESVRSAASELDKRVRAIASERPIVAVLGALLVGFLTARLISRRHA